MTGRTRALLLGCAFSAVPDGSAAREQSESDEASKGRSSEPLVTDRPDFTESTDAVPTGRFQIEIGYLFSHDREHDERTRTHEFPQTLFRIGIAEPFELRLGWGGYAFGDFAFENRNAFGRRFTDETDDQGGSDTSVGFKVKLAEQAGLRPNLGLIAEMSLPSGSTDQTSGDVDPNVKFLWAYDLNDRFSLSGNVNVGVPTEDTHRFVQTAVSLSLACGLTDSVGSYVEYFGVYPDADGQDAAHSLNGGFTFLLSDDLQFDVLVGVGLNEQADDFFTGVGVSWRF
ncbi:MAG: transporter [Phycisphaerales bacterium]|nr:transporter [Phycisphaerales bacterium]